MLDVQECPAADLAYAELIVAVLKKLVFEPELDISLREQFPTQKLKSILDATIEQAEDAKLVDRDYLKLFGHESKTTLTASEFWHSMCLHPTVVKYMTPENHELASRLLNGGTLATRIQRVVGNSPSKEEIASTYEILCNCLETNSPFKV